METEDKIRYNEDLKDFEKKVKILFFYLKK